MKPVLVLAVAFSLCTAHVEGDEEDVRSSSGQPNVVLFFVDDLGFGDLPLYGNPTTYTPNINKMANYGLTFTNFYSSSSVCTPSRAALLTGRYQMRSGIYPGVFDPSDLGGLPHNETTIAEGLKDVGYTTGMVGKWHLGVGRNGTYLPTRHGFDSYFGIPYTHDACPCITCYPDVSCPEQCHNEAEYVGCPLMSNETIVQQPVDLTTLSEHIVNSAVDFVYNATASGKPFFLYYAFHHTHWPQFAGKRFYNSSIAGPLGDSLREIDFGVGSIFQALRNTGSYYNTMVIFTADNGPDLEHGSWGGSAGPLRCGKTTTYEGGFRVPTIVWWPGRIKIGRTFRLATSHDWLPTIFKMAGAQTPVDRTIDGVDLSSILYYDKDNGKDLVAFFPEFADKDIGPYAIRWKHYKAHFYTSGGNAPPSYHDSACRNTTELAQHNPPILYDLWLDPGEKTPLDSYEYTWLVEKMYYVRQKFVKDLEWAYPQMEVGRDKSVQPCAVPGCEPWPTCCQIDLLNNNDDNNGDDQSDDDSHDDDNENKYDYQKNRDDKESGKKYWKRPKWAQL